MIKTKRFVKPSYIIHNSKNQLGNTLIPVIIALAISAVASITFLRQGAELSVQAQVQQAQQEVASILKEWDILKVSVGIDNITRNSSQTSGNFPSILTNIYGKKVIYHPNFKNTTNRKVLAYYLPDDISICERIYAAFTNAAGISQKPIANTAKGGTNIIVNPTNPLQPPNLTGGSTYPKCSKTDDGYDLLLPLK